MSEKRYIGLIHEERDDNFTIGYNISTNINKMLKWKEEMLECGNVEDCKVFEIKEINQTQMKNKNKEDFTLEEKVDNKTVEVEDLCCDCGKPRNWCAENGYYTTSKYRCANCLEDYLEK